MKERQSHYIRNPRNFPSKEKRGHHALFLRSVSQSFLSHVTQSSASFSFRAFQALGSDGGGYIAEPQQVEDFILGMVEEEEEMEVGRAERWWGRVGGSEGDH